jgi:DNA-binding response OmpR family regulator
MKKIMVVDDDKDLLAALKEFLKIQGYNVAVFTSCAEGLDTLASFNPDLIFLDVNVGTEDGRDMCRTINTMADHKDIPIVLISANGDALRTYNAYGAASFLRKPFQPSQLLKVAASYLFPNH